MVTSNVTVPSVAKSAMKVDAANVAVLPVAGVGVPAPDAAARTVPVIVVVPPDAVAATPAMPAGVSTRFQLPSALMLALAIWAMLMTWPWSAPTWNAWFMKLPLSNGVPLKLVSSATRWISAFSSCTSASSAMRSELELVALRDCTASSRMRCRLLLISPSAPSAVCASEMPSLALRAAWFMPRIWVVKRSEMASPAASSLALLMRRPEDRRWMLVASAPPLVFRLRWAFSDMMLVLMICAMGLLRCARVLPDKGKQCFCVGLDQRIMLNSDMDCICVKRVCAACRAALSSLYWPMASA